MTTRVILFDKIKAKTCFVRLKVGSIIPASVWQSQKFLVPFYQGTIVFLKFHWISTQPNVIELSGVFADAGIEYDKIDSISIRVNGLNPGKAQIYATVIISNGVKLNSTVKVSVLKMLELESPKQIISNVI